MVVSGVKHIQKKVDPKNPLTGLQEMIKIVRPEWDSSLVQFKISPNSASTGLLNTMVVASIDDAKKDAIMFRVYGYEELVQKFLNRDREVFNAKLIHDLYSFAPNVLATYTNGFCYDYIHGEIMTPETVRLNETWRTIAKQIALFHSTKVESSLQQNAKLHEYYTMAPEDYPEFLDNPDYNKIFQEKLPKKEFVIRAVKEITEIIEKQKCIKVFCHNDLRPENMIWNKKTGVVTFVDFEAAGFANQAGDIAYHLWRYAGVENPDYSKFPDKEFQMMWLRVYLETFNRETKGSDNVSQLEIERLYIQVNTYYLLYLIRTVGFVSYVDKMDDLKVDFFSSIVSSYYEFCKVKDYILSLQMPNDETSTVILH